MITVTVEMMRDGPEDTQVVSAVEVIEVAQDQNGKTLTSLVVVPSDAAASSTRDNKPVSTLLTCLQKLTPTAGTTFQPEAGVLPVTAVDMEELRKKFNLLYIVTSETEKARKATLRSAFKRAVDDGQFENRIRVANDPATQKAMVWRVAGA